MEPQRNLNLKKAAQANNKFLRRNVKHIIGRNKKGFSFRSKEKKKKGVRSGLGVGESQAEGTGAVMKDNRRSTTSKGTRGWAGGTRKKKKHRLDKTAMRKRSTVPCHNPNII